MGSIDSSEQDYVVPEAPVRKQPRSQMAPVLSRQDDVIDLTTSAELPQYIQIDWQRFNGFFQRLPRNFVNMLRTFCHKNSNFVSDDILAPKDDSLAHLIKRE